MSVVYRAHDRLLDREVALKLLRLSEEDPRNLLYLQQEFRAMVRLRHPRLVQVFDYGVLDSGSSYFTMELLAGEDLSNFGKLTLDAIFQLLLSIADVLAFMHARGYVHRDVKPSNVRILPSEPGAPLEVKLMDCGLTEQLGRHGSAVAGTLAYLAPEAWLGSPSDVRGDLYALGVLAYEITAGQLPFDASTGVRLLKTKTERPRDLRDVRPEVPADFARLVRDLLTPEPANRPASATEVVARLCELANVDFNPDPAIYLRAPALVGRSRELTELREAITEAFSSRPHPTIITGPAGAGKTRLLDEALLEIGLRGAVIARAVARGFAGGPYEVLEDLIAPLLHLPAAETILSRIGGRSAITPAKATRAEDAADAAARNLDPVAARRAMHLAFATFVDGISRHRMVVFAIDDIHLADAASLDALISLVTAGIYGNIAIVATLRTGEPTSQSLEHLMALGRRLDLDRMTREQIGELMVGALGPVAPSPTLVEDIERASSGNVYFALEILRNLATRGLIERKRTKICLPESLDTAGLPHSLSEALERRIALLLPAALRVARIGAILNHTMEFGFARTISRVSDEEFLDAIDELRCQELIDVQDRCIRIHHPRLREVLYQGIGDEERRQLHRDVAEEILRQPDPDNRDRSAELGHHFAEAGDAIRALEYLVQAGDARYQRFAYFDAREAYQRALDLTHAASWTRRRDLERKLNDRLGRICFYHDHRRGPKYLEIARRHHLRHGALWLIAPLSRLLGSPVAVAFGVGITILYNAMRLRTRPVQRTLERLVDYFAATTYLSSCFVYSGRCPAALAASAQLAPFVNSNDRIPRVAYLMARVVALWIMGRYDESAAGCEEALSVLKRDNKTPVSEHDRIHATGGAIITRLWIDLERGYAKNSRWWKPLEELVRDHPTAMLESWLREVRLFAAYRQGKLAETEQAWKRIVEKAAEAEVKFVYAKSKVWLGAAYLDAGKTSEAMDVADEVLSAAESLDNPFLFGHGARLRGMALHVWERLDDAEACLEEGARVTAQPDVACWESHNAILLCQAAIAFERKDYLRACELAQSVLDHNAGLVLAHDLHRCRAHRILGKVALAEGRTEDALRLLETALTLASEFDDVLERAQSLHFLAQAQRANSDEIAAERCKIECIQLLNELGNAHQLRRLGYASADAPVSSGGVSVLSRVAQLVSDTEPNGRSTDRSESAGATAPQAHPSHGSLLQGSPVPDKTLVVTQTSNVFSSQPE